MPAVRHPLRAPAAAVVALVLAACNTHLFPTQSAYFRGITIPLPPPSIVDDPQLTVDIEGSVPDPEPGTLAALWESELVRGYLVDVDDDGNYTFEDIQVVAGQSCLQLWYQWEEDGQTQRGTDAFYQVVIMEGADCDDDLCSAPDDQGACACLLQRDDGC
jgi:hypothetical protein